MNSSLVECPLCGLKFTNRGLLNHLYSLKEDGWYDCVQSIYKDRFNSLGLTAEFISYEGNEYTYKCLISNEITRSRTDRLEKHKVCGCNLCQFNHKSKVSVNSWKDNYSDHCKSISDGLLSCKHHRERSALQCVMNFRNSFGNNAWSNSEIQIDKYLTCKGIKHYMNYLVLHYKENINYIYDVYIPDYNIVIELNDKHLTDHLFTYDELELIKHLKTKYSVALQERIKQDLAEYNGYKCYSFYNLDECKSFIDKF